MSVDETYSARELELMSGSAGVLKGRFGTKRPELSARIEKRIKTERKNTRTPKEQRRSENKKSKLINFRATPDFHAALGTWASAANMSAGALIETAVKEYAKQKKLKAKNEA